VKYPSAPREWPWQWIFPARRHYVDAASGDSTAADATQSDASGAMPDAMVGFDVIVKDAFHPTPKPDSAVPSPPCITDGGFPCPTPQSHCLDDYWLRYYQSGACADGGCVFQVADVLCEPEVPNAEPPFCENGGCKFVILR
jgi:hypothetical protein